MCVGILWVRRFTVSFGAFHFGSPFADGGGSTEVTRFDLGGLYRFPESDSAHLLFAV
nr:MAG TPA: hypothetical protein [Caudoviricetes sp.]